MASASFQIQRGAGIDTLSAGAQNVVEGVAAPTTANAIELRVDLAAGWTRKEVEVALKVIYNFLKNNNNSTSIPL